MRRAGSTFGRRNEKRPPRGGPTQLGFCDLHHFRPFTRNNLILGMVVYGGTKRRGHCLGGKRPLGSDWFGYNNFCNFASLSSLGVVCPVPGPEFFGHGQVRHHPRGYRPGHRIFSHLRLVLPVGASPHLVGFLPRCGVDHVLGPPHLLVCHRLPPT